MDDQRGRKKQGDKKRQRKEGGGKRPERVQGEGTGRSPERKPEKSDGRRPERKRGPRRPYPTSIERAEGILREFNHLGRTIMEEYGLTGAERLPLNDVVLPVSIEMGWGSRPEQERSNAQALLDSFKSRLKEGMKALSSFRMGRVYCFQCDSPECIHTMPGDPAEVFGGYTPTGKPAWKSFPTLCMEREEPRVDRLYGDFPEVIAFAQEADELKGELLPGFGSGSLTFSVAGQVVAGLVPSDLGSSRSPDGRIALTLQLVETRSGVEKRRLRLNVVGISPDDIAAAADAGPPRSQAVRLSEAMRLTRQRLNSLGREVAIAERGGKRIFVEDKVRPILTQLRGDVERIFRPQRHRTEHASQRHEHGDRPTGLALEDSLKAPSEKFLLDVRNKTYVILGPKNRAHVFSPEGMHVTSMQLEAGELDRKTGRRRWQPMDPAVVADFRRKLTSHGRPEDE